MRSSSTWAAAIAAAIVTVTSNTAGAPSPMQPSPARELIVIGASYAGGWGTPTLPGYTVTNRGAGGEETTAVLARFDTDVIAAKPDAVIIWGHINDIFRAPGGDMDAAARKAKDNLRLMMERARAAGIEPVIATEITLSRPGGALEMIASLVGKLLGKQSYQERVNRRVRDVNDFLRKHAAQQGLRLLDFERAFDDGAGFRRREFSDQDGSHISPTGYAHLTAHARSAWVADGSADRQRRSE